MRVRATWGVVLSLTVSGPIIRADEVAPPAVLRQPTSIVPVTEDGAVIAGESRETRADANTDCQCDACRASGGVGHRVKQHWQTSTKPKLQYSHWGYSNLFQVRPFGTYARGALNTQIVNGLGAQLSLYHYDFLDADGEPAVKLSARGLDRLDRIVCLLPHSLCPVVIERSTNAELDEARRLHVIEMLEKWEVPVPSERVVVGKPLPRGLDAIEAVPLHYNTVQNFSQGAGSGAAINPASGPGAGLGVGTQPSSSSR